MQSKDIKVGVEYVYKRWKHDPGFKAKVLATGVEHEVEQKSGASWRTQKVTKRNGVQIKVKVYSRTQTIVVEPRTLVEPWADYVERKEASDNYRAECIARMKVSAEKVRSLLPGKVWEKHLRHESAAKGEVFPDGSYSVNVRLSVHDLAEMLEAAYEKGRQDASA